jgi:hypothetical protein
MNNEIRTLPTSGYIRVSDLADFLGCRIDKVQKRLKEHNVPVVRLSSHEKMQILSIAALEQLNE